MAFRKYIALCCALVLTLLPLRASAQISLLQLPDTATPVKQLLLSSQASTYSVTPYIRAFPDAQGDMSFAQIMSQFRQGRGILLGDDTFFAGYGDNGYWLVFSVYNRNPTKSRWMLDFGLRGDGTSGLSDKIFIFTDEAPAAPILMSGREMPVKRHVFGQQKNAVPLTLMPGQSRIIGIFIKATPGVAVVTPLRLIDLETFTQVQEKRDFERNIMNGLLMFFLTVLGVYYAVYRKEIPVYVGAYVLAQYYIYTHTDAIALFGNVLSGRLAEGFVTLALLSSLFITRAMLLPVDMERTKESLQASRLMIVAGAIIVGLFALAMLLPASGIFATMVLERFGMLFISALVAYLSAYAVFKAGRSDLMIFTLAWIILFAGLLAAEISLSGIVFPTPAMVTAGWTAFALHLILLSFSSLRFVSLSESLRKKGEETQKHKREQEAETRRTKELADQSRLLGVMQREKELMADLRNREAERIEALKRAKEIADQANKAKSDFLAVISHEIRTPMTGIMGMIRLLLDSSLNAKQREYAMTIQYAGDGLITLLNDILDFSKVEEGKMTIEHVNFDLLKLVESVMLLMSGRAEEKKIYLRSEIDPQTPAMLKGDPTRIRQILLNLVGNAIKFTDKGGVTVIIKLHDAAGKKPRIYFSVRDTGIGIPEEAQKKLFSPYAQADASVARNFGGTGLGLAICKRLTEAMGGNIMLESAANKGSNFYFILPLETVSAEEAAHAATPDKVTPLKVLVVDDNVINQKVVTGLLEKDGHKIVCAGSAEGALNEIKSVTFDVVLMDMQMPGSDGLAATRMIRALPDQGKAHMHIVAMTANTRQEDIQKCKEAGMNEYLSKPVNPETLRKILQVLAAKIKPAAVPPTPQKPTETPAPVTQTPPAAPQAAAPAAPAEDVAPNTKLFNPEVLGGLKESLGKDKLYEMMDELYSKTEELIAAAEKAIADKSISAAGDRGHDIKGMTSNFGLTGLADLASRLERQARENFSADVLADIVRKMRPAFYDTRSAVEKWIKQ